MCLQYLKSNRIRKLNQFELGICPEVVFRYIRKSIEILLHANNIKHGDLSNNVMIDKHDKVPRIIDWENAKLL